MNIPSGYRTRSDVGVSVFDDAAWKVAIENFVRQTFSRSFRADFAVLLSTVTQIHQSKIEDRSCCVAVRLKDEAGMTA
ncbi:hypothetical protein [Sphingomonas sp.]|jgi:hypothetical protein|uniref:hypothetical protein n=1 Tax=Sphingomonas sp. TaxID=28214 RepID=UPI0035C841E4